jgi:hypothetical protein
MLTKVKNVLDITADTVADLANVQHKTGSIQLLGFHTKGDGGGGVFYWDATKDKAEHNGGTVIDPSIAGLVANWEYTQNLYFTPAVIGQGCWVREYSGAIDFSWFGLGLASNDDASLINLLIEQLGLQTASSFSKKTNKPLISVVFPKRNYTIKSTITLYPYIDYDFNHSQLTFVPDVAGSNMFEIKPNWNVSTTPTAINTRVRKISCVGDYNKIDDTGDGRACFYLDKIAYFYLEDFSIYSFKIGLESGNGATIGSYYNFFNNGAFATCREALWIKSNAYYFSNCTLLTGSGAYANPPLAYIKLERSSCQFTNCDVELSSTSGITTSFDCIGGSVNVEGGYHEGGTYIARVDMQKHKNAESTLKIEFSVATASGIYWYNDNETGYLYTLSRYLNRNQSQSGHVIEGAVKYNQQTGEGQNSNNATISSDTVLGRTYPKFSSPDNSSKYVFYKVYTPPSILNNFVHLIYKGTPSSLRLDGETLRPVAGFATVNYFEDLDITHKVVQFKNIEDTYGFLKIYLTTGEVTLLNIYLSTDPYLFTLANQGDYAPNVPISGTWKQGDIVNNSDPDAGDYLGWVCTVAGTPGTWKGFGLIEA